MGRVVAHLDADAFFATCHELADPSLVGKAVIVGGSGPRSIVTTASYAARRYGVQSAMPMSRARSLCPQAILITPQMQMYRDVSSAVWGVVRDELLRGGAMIEEAGELVAHLEQAGIDEAYADLSRVPRQDALGLLRRAIAAVRSQTGIQLSVGVAPSRLLAKICSDLDKPAGFTVLSREMALQRLRDMALSDVPGIGPRTAEILAEKGFSTHGDLRGATESQLLSLFGNARGAWLVAVAAFTADSPIVVSRPRKSVSSERTFDDDVAYDEDPDAEPTIELRETIVRLADDTSTQVRSRGFRGRNVAVKIRTGDWETFTRARTLPFYTDQPEIIRQAALELWEQHRPQAPIRLLGVRVSAFEHVENEHVEDPQMVLPFDEADLP